MRIKQLVLAFAVMALVLVPVSTLAHPGHQHSPLNDGGANDPMWNCGVAIANTDGYPGPTTAQAKADLGLDVMRLGTECAAFVWRGSPNSTQFTCPVGGEYTCTMDVVDVGTRVYLGNGQTKMIYAVTARYIGVYPRNEGDPCSIAAAEYGFGTHEWNSFDALMATDAGFTCAGVEPVDDSSGNAASGSCVTSPEGAVEATGGTSNSANWQEHGTNRWYYGGAEVPSNGPEVVLHGPATGWIDVDPAVGGDAADGMLVAGESASVVQGTLNCG